MQCLLQCVAVCCSVLQCVAVCCSVLQCVTMFYSVLRSVSVCCGMLQHTRSTEPPLKEAVDVATHCNTLQHTATHCNKLQHTATHCNTLQHTATRCNKYRWSTEPPSDEVVDRMSPEEVCLPDPIQSVWTTKLILIRIYFTHTVCLSKRCVYLI